VPPPARTPPATLLRITPLVFLIASAAGGQVETAAPTAGEPEIHGTSPVGIGVEARQPALTEPGVSSTGILEGLRSPSPSTPCYLLVRAGRADLESPERLDPVLHEAAELGLRVVLRLTEEGWSPPRAGSVPGPESQAAPAFPFDAWVGEAAVFAARAADRVFAYQILEAPNRLSARAYAYLVKRAAVAIRAVRPGTPIVSGPIGLEDAAWAETLLVADTAPYLDVLAARGLPVLTMVADLRDRLDPRAALWVSDGGLDPAAPRASAARAFFDALAAGAEVVLLGLPAAPAPAKEPATGTAPAATGAIAAPEAGLGPGAGRAPEAGAAAGLGALLTRLRALLSPGMSPASFAALPFDPAAALAAGGMPPSGAAPKPVIAALAFFEAERREGLMVYRATEAVPGEAVRFAARAPLEWLELFDPLSDSERRIGARVPAGVVVAVPIRADDIVLRFRVMSEATPLQESVRIGTTTELTAEEIIAREREFHAAQARRLQHYEARAAINIHYRIASLDTSVDVLTENRLYVHDGKQDYQQTEMYVDGARWRGKNPPYLPFLQPDKVKEVPLDIVLDEGYRYALLGREKVQGRECYVIAMHPLATDRSLYEGRVYIDTKIFARVRMDAVQTGVKEPLRSNHVTYEFGPIAAPSGTFWLPIEVRGQMVFEVLGQNLVVERGATYSDFAINQEGFGDRVSGAYASGLPIFRDTSEGYYKVDRSGGEERLQSVSTPRNVFLVAGINMGIGGSPGPPFAGVNFFDFDFHGTGNQVDVAWAGPFLIASWTDPRLTHPEGDRRPLSLSVEGDLSGLKRRDKNAREAGTDAGENVDILTESARAALALPMGHFAKWTIETRAAYMNFFRRHEETSTDFTLPVTALEESLLLRLEVNRAGYIIAPWAEAARRSRWDCWGFGCAGASPPPREPFDPRDRDFTRRGLDLLKSFYIGPLRKISLAISGYDGKSLDRFSRFELGDFRSARVRGFNGSGIHFDRGLTAAAAYAFTLRGTMRVDAGLETGWIRSLDDFGPGYERVIGGGVGLEFSGPWSTLVDVRMGRGFSSTIPDKGGGGDIRVVFFRTWDRWSRRPQPSE